MDLFDEIREDITKQKYLEIWNKFGIYFVIILFLFVASSLAYLILKQNKEEGLRQTSVIYSKMLKQESEQSYDKMLETIAEIESQGRGGLKYFAEFKKAEYLNKTGKSTQAIEIYQNIKNNDDIEKAWRDLASLQIVRIKINQDVNQQILSEIEQALEDRNVFYYSFAELKALYFIKTNNKDGAKAELENILLDKQAPGSVRNRAAIINQSIK